MLSCSVHAWVNAGDASFLLRAASELALKRKLSFPVSRMWQRWVRRSRSAVVILASPKIVAHSLKLRSVARRCSVRWKSWLRRWKSKCPARGAGVGTPAIRTTRSARGALVIGPALPLAFSCSSVSTSSMVEKKRTFFR